MSGRPTALQSALEPASVNALIVDELTTVLVIGSAAIFALVMALAIHAAARRAPEVSTRRWVIGGGLVFPVVVLTALLAYALVVGNALSVEASADALAIRVTGKRWWWEVRYPNAGAGSAVAISANEIHIPVGRSVKLLLDTDDVIHSLWVPPLGGKVDMIPGRVNHLVLRAERAGVYRGQCAEYCGAQHAYMALYVIAHEPADFERWLEREAKPVETSAAQRGHGLFSSAGCASCHSIRGTSADGRLGPDLTHVASRVSLAAGMLDNNRATMAGWIANSQALKPGNLMPPMKVSADELRALTDYMMSLQ